MQNFETIQTKKLNLFEFSDYSEFLNRHVSMYGRYGHGPYNLKNWANRLGYRSASSLTMILNKSRLPTYKMINAFSEDFKFNQNERRYFELLVELERRKKNQSPINEIIDEIKKISGFSEYQQINVDEFSVVSDWYCYAIKALVGLKYFKLDIEWIFERLRRKVSKVEIKKGIESLERIGMIQFDTNIGFVDGAPQTHTGNDVPSAAIRNHHRGMMEKGIDALDEQTVDERFFQSITLCIDKEMDYSSASEEIQKFINSFNRKYSNKNTADSVYQLNIQFFQHTQSVDSKRVH